MPAFWAGLVGAYWYVWTGFWGPDGHLVALGLLVLSFLHWLPQRYAAVKKSWFFWAILLFGGYVALRGLAGYWQQPSTGHQQLSDVVQLFYIGGVVSLLLTPWFLGKEGKFRIEFSVFLIFLGFLINIGLLVEWEAGWQGIQDQLLSRPGFRMNPNAFGATAGIVLLGVLAVGFRWLARMPNTVALPWRVLAWAAWLVALVFMGESVLFSQSRASWLATVVAVLTVLVLLLVFSLRRQGNARRTRAVGGLGLVILLGVGVGLIHSPVIQKRVRVDQETFRVLAQFNWQELPPGSIGNRIRLYRFGLEKIPERPLFGWSPAGVRGLLKRQEQPLIHKGYMHNFPLEITMEVGLVGAILFFGMVAFSVREVGDAYRQDRLPPEVAAFWFGSLVFLAVEGMFDAPFHHSQYSFLLLFLGAIAIACHFDRFPGIQQPAKGAPRE